MYEGNMLSAHLHDGTRMKLEQVTNYPWDGTITITINETVAKPVNIYLRMPCWCKKYSLRIKNVLTKANNVENGYINIGSNWKTGDKIELVLDMDTTLLESNPLVVANRNQVVVKRVTIVYFLESVDLPNQNVFDVMIPTAIQLKPVPMKIDIGYEMALIGEARLLQKRDWKNTLYKELNHVQC